MVKILIADDHALIRRGLKEIIADQPDMRVVGEAENAAQTLALLRKQEWDVLVLDINMPGQSGLDILREVSREQPRLPVLILSAHPEDQFGARVLKAGAAGFINKESAPEELVKAIRKVCQGGKYVSESLAETLISSLRGDSHQLPHERLSDREYQVMLMLAEGRTASEIAEELNLSVKTISTYRFRVMEKMNFKTNAELMRYAIRHKLVE
ncbi:MAG TPA: response regulator transcription factor [Blastocatellia bacterium]|nr:response regulator transcription factor [Blastocatellia bacterium]